MSEDQPNTMGHTTTTCSIDNCARRVVAWGWCDTHYRRWKRNGAPEAYATPKTVEQRFWEKVSKSDACWLWTAGKDAAGYGSFHIDGRMVSAHRVSYELEFGPIPNNLWIDHRCHTPACVNPGHLRLATPKQNAENRKGPDSDNACGLRGVSKIGKYSRWRARVKHNQKNLVLGLYRTPEEAAEVARLKRLELFTHNDVDRSEAS